MLELMKKFGYLHNYMQIFKKSCGLIALVKFKKIEHTFINALPVWMFNNYETKCQW